MATHKHLPSCEAQSNGKRTRRPICRRSGCENKKNANIWQTMSTHNGKQLCKLSNHAKYELLVMLRLINGPQHLGRSFCNPIQTKKSFAGGEKCGNVFSIAPRGCVMLQFVAVWHTHTHTHVKCCGWKFESIAEDFHEQFPHIIVHLSTARSAFFWSAYAAEICAFQIVQINGRAWCKSPHINEKTNEFKFKIFKSCCAAEGQEN